MTECTEERFLRDVANHQMTVIRDDGVNRHIRFSKPDSGDMQFDLITWQGYLCYCGDMGTYVFRRINDMFQFFRTDREYMCLPEGQQLAINPGYWSEKLEAISCFGGGFEVFNMDKFKKAVKEEFDEFIADNGFPDDKRESLLEEIDWKILSAENEHAAMSAIYEFSYEGADSLFVDFFEHDFQEYTFHFIWCCYALAWGISKYDENRLTTEGTKS